MRRYIYYLTTLLSVLLVSVELLGQTALPPSNEQEEKLTGTDYKVPDGGFNYSGKGYGYTINSGKNVTIDLNGQTIVGGNEALFNVVNGTLNIVDNSANKTGKLKGTKKTCFYIAASSGKTVTLNLHNGTIEDCQPSNGEGGGVEVDGTKGTATFNMYGGKITGCRASQGAGVYVHEGTFNMKGGEIVDNKIFAVINNLNQWHVPEEGELPPLITGNSDNNTNKIPNKSQYGVGGGVYVESGTFTMTGGTISGNIASNGGGVYLISGAKFTLEGGSIINNYATSTTNHGNGGGIYLHGGSSATIKGINVTGNRSTRYGGGVYVNGSTITLDNCTISDNYAGAGGGLAQDGTGCTMSLNNCIVDKNYSIVNSTINFTNTGSGGGLYIGNGGTSNTTKNTLNIQSSTLSDNIAQVSGGGVYTGTNTVITVKQGSYATLNGNTSNTANGGGIYQVGGTLTVQSGGQLNVGTSGKPNKAPNGNGGGIYCGGAFEIQGNANVNYNSSLNGGGIYCKGTFTVNQNANLAVGNNTAKNGGGICIENGTISLPAGENNVISNNTATELGGGLYVVNSTSANFDGGKFSYNTAKSGGAVAAVNTTSGKTTTLHLGAEMENNTASAGNGGGIYMNSGIHMTFGDGLIRLNRAESDGGNYTTANQKDHSSVQGVGGGIFMGSSCTLDFDSKEMGIYNNYAENAGADICANGSSTSIELPNISNMTLRDWNIPTTKTGLYWVEDYFTGEDYTDVSNQTKKGIRYQDALNDPNNDIYNYQVTGGQTYSNYLCLDLGYDLVFVKITTEGLDACDDASIQISYPRNENEGATDTNLEHYRKVLFLGAETKIVGLPSGKWNFEPTEWSYKYELEESRPAHVNGFIDIANSNSGDGTDGTDALTIKFRVKNKLENIREYNHRVVNRMVPKTQSGN